jgi:hypothetical protein
MLPAEKLDGVRHVHGFLRVPARAEDTPLSVLTVQTHGEITQILAPKVVARVAHYMRWWAHGPT